MWYFSLFLALAPEVTKVLYFLVLKNRSKHCSLLWLQYNGIAVNFCKLSANLS
jgi:hypothetical protein